MLEYENDEVLDIYKFMKKYKKDILEENISDELVRNMSMTLIEAENTTISIYTDCIRKIIIAAITVECITKIDGHTDVFKMGDLFINLTFLKKCYKFENYKKASFDKAYKSVEDSVYSEFLDQIDKDEIYNNLLDVNYYISTFRKYLIDGDTEFEEFLNMKVWRYVSFL